MLVVSLPLTCDNSNYLQTWPKIPTSFLLENYWVNPVPGKYAELMFVIIITGCWNSVRLDGLWPPCRSCHTTPEGYSLIPVSCVLAGPGFKIPGIMGTVNSLTKPGHVSAMTYRTDKTCPPGDFINRRGLQKGKIERGVS